MKNAFTLAAFLALTPALLPQRAPEPPITAILPKAEEIFPLGPTPSSADVSSPAPTTTSATPTPTRSRAFSPETAAKINAGSPKFSPTKAQDTAAADVPDLRETDKPRNGIIRLPQVMVQEQKIPVLKDRDLLTREGKLQEAYQRRPGLRIGSFSIFSNDGPALVLREEDLRLERLAEATELVTLYRYSDPKAGAALSHDIVPLFLRPQGWINSGGSHALARQQ